MTVSSKSRLNLFLIVSAYIFLSFFNYTIIEEDAYIFFRCAENIAAGNGYVFNKGGDQVEACSSFSWLFLLAFLKVSGFNILILSKIAGIVIGIFSLWLVFRITRHFMQPDLWSYVPCLLTAVNIPFFMRNQMGMETSLFTVVFLLLVLVCLEKSKFMLWPFVYFLLAVTRPEGMFMILAVAPAVYFAPVERSKKMISICICFILLSGLFLCRLFYFHDFLPSSFYFKVHPDTLRMGILYTHMFFRDFYMYFFIIPVLFFVFKKWNYQVNRTVLLCFIGVHVAWIIVAGADFFPFYRHFVPVIPLIFIYVVSGLIQAVNPIMLKKKYILSTLIAVYGAVALLLPPSNWLIVPEPNVVIGNMRQFIKNPKKFVNNLFIRLNDPRYDKKFRSDRQIQVGCFIAQHYKEGTRFVFDQMGRVPYQAGLAYGFIDSYGLTDKHIGRYVFYHSARGSFILSSYESISRYIISKVFPGTDFYFTDEGILDYLFTKDPDVILCLVPIRNRVINGLADDPRFKNRYRLAFSLNHVLFFERNDIERKKLIDIDKYPRLIFADDVSDIYGDHPLIKALHAF